MSDDPKSLYRQAYFVRCFEEALAKAHDDGHVPGLLHLCCGAEVAEALLCNSLDNSRDQVTGSHRSHGLALLMGASPDKIAKEILGRVGGLSNGMGGTQHIIAPEDGFLTSNGIVGAQVPLALGAALTAKTKGTGGVGVAVFGDGAANQGAVLESFNLAVALSLPVMFFLENNGMAQSTKSDYSAPGGSFAARARAFGLKCFDVDPSDIATAQATLKEAVHIARVGQPVFIEAKTVRLSGHYHGDADNQTDQPHDPLMGLRSFILENGENEGTLTQIEKTCAEECKDILATASSAPVAALADCAIANHEVQA